ncbi:MAG TPA: alpha-amylase/4-alpha-glucanotransferase domain-containing protein [Candidatus Polarisedimenticolia bacterium]|nr:alpha-amylase/4-alpha-glucanotransferase domain-containing protein [Candidatus Polarisedimenticolia bacterium]
MRKFELVLLIHAHQPVGNFDDVFERAYASSYLPFLEVLARHPSIRVGLHYSGPLLQWIERAHPVYFDQLRALVGSGQVEMVGGGFYEPILVAIPPEDRREQITRLADYIEKHFGRRPHGAWVAERVWEPQIPSFLASAGVDYTLVDDNHFLGAGCELDQLYGHYFSEDLGHAVRVLPGLKLLRYLIPFHSVGETVEFLRTAANEHPGGFATMGDDLEKFGIWPGTNKLCYQDGWLEQFFTALEQASDWLALSTPGDAIASHDPLGRADLPSASYTEMMEWALPTPARNRYHGLVAEFSSRPDALPFLRGGIWRSFFTKYREANLLHKKMLHVSQKVRRLARKRRRDSAFREACEEATTLLLQGQCNDAYWHGIFGGLYSPHLRTAVWRSLEQAETIADRLTHRAKRYADAAAFDFDSDGHDEVYFTSDCYAALLVPDDGGTLSMLAFRPSNVTLINSIARRRESYHAKIQNPPVNPAQSVKSIHEQMRVKEEGLERWLNYDRWPRNSFRVLLFSQEKNHEAYASIRLEEDAALAGGRYRVAELTRSRVAMVSEDGTDWAAKKTLSFRSTASGFDVLCDLELRRNGVGTASVYVGMEVVANFLAPATADRYFESDGQRFPLRWTAELPGMELRLVDEWQRVSLALEAQGAQRFWTSPIETVSESEDGFERIYQGSQVAAVWPVELATGGEWKGQFVLKAARLD